MISPPAQSGGDTGQCNVKLSCAGFAALQSLRLRADFQEGKAFLTLPHKKKFSALFGSTYSKIREIQRRLAWPLCKNNVQIQTKRFIVL